MFSRSLLLLMCGVLPLLVAGCGQSGVLYLPDELQAEQLERRAMKANSPARAEQWRARAAAVRERQQQELALRSQLDTLQASEQRLRSEGNHVEADELRRKAERIEYELVGFALQRQSESQP